MQIRYHTIGNTRAGKMVPVPVLTHVGDDLYID